MRECYHRRIGIAGMTAQRATLLDVVERFFTPTLLAKVVSDGIESGDVELATFEDLEVLTKLAGMAEYTQGMRLLRLVDGAVGSVEPPKLTTHVEASHGE